MGLRKICSDLPHESQQSTWKKLLSFVYRLKLSGEDAAHSLPPNSRMPCCADVSQVPEL